MGLEIRRLLCDQRRQELDKRKQGQPFDPVWASGALLAMSKFTVCCMPLIFIFAACCAQSIKLLNLAADWSLFT